MLQKALRNEEASYLFGFSAAKNTLKPAFFMMVWGKNFKVQNRHGRNSVLTLGDNLIFEK